jgi:hypothetical protein
LLLEDVIFGLGHRKEVCRWDREERSIQSFGEIAIISTNGIMYSDKISSVFESAFNLDFVKTAYNRRLTHVNTIPRKTG